MFLRTAFRFVGGVVGGGVVAASVVLGTAGRAAGEVVYVPFEDEIINPRPSAGGGIAFVDLDGDTSFSVQGGSGPSPAFAAINAVIHATDRGLVLDPITNWATALTANTPIGPTQTFSTASGLMYRVDEPGVASGNFAPGIGERYIGFSALLPGDVLPTYGYIAFRTDSATLTGPDSPAIVGEAVAYAYESVPGVPILAGAVPEPGAAAALGFLAGAAALRGGRRRRPRG